MAARDFGIGKEKLCLLIEISTTDLAIVFNYNGIRQ
jgi:hypothetical protein